MGAIGILTYGFCESANGQDTTTSEIKPDPTVELRDEPRLMDEGAYSVAVRDLKNSENKHDLESKITTERALNALFYYRGAEGQLTSVDSYSNQGFFQRWAINFEKSLNKEVFISDYSNNNYEENHFPYDRQAWDSFGDALVEKYKIARQIDSGIKKVQSAVTLSYQNQAGIKFRLNPYIDQTDVDYIGIRGTASSKYGNIIAKICPNNFRIGYHKRNKSLGGLYIEWGIKLQEDDNHNKEIMWMAGYRAKL